MKYFLAGALIIPVLLWGQSKPPTVVKPQYNEYSFTGEAQDNTNQGTLSNLLIPTDIVATTATETAVISEIEITTELGSTTVPLRTATSVAEEVETRLSNVVEKINQDYEIAEKQCQNGSWLRKIWCSFTSWF